MEGVSAMTDSSNATNAMERLVSPIRDQIFCRVCKAQLLEGECATVCDDCMSDDDRDERREDEEDDTDAG